jgi:sugar phosphate isomerase/epimerase
MLLGLGAAAIAAAVPRGADARMARPRATLVIGVQLYTLRTEMRRNPQETLARIAALGYTDVEWWGSWGLTPAQLRDLLDRNGLTSSAAHIDPAELAPDRLPQLIERAQRMGHRELIVAWTPPQERTADGWRRLAARLSDAGRVGAAAGITTGYHNHDFEFGALDGRTPWSILVDESDASTVNLELDCFWAFKAGQDPMTLLRRHAPRVRRLHLKDSSGAPEHQQMDVGAGVIDWKALLVLSQGVGVTHAYVEHDAPTDAWDSVRLSRAYLASIGY